MRIISTLFFCFFIFFSEDETLIECEYSEKICSAIEELNLNKKKWLDSNTTSYSMSFSVSCVRVIILIP